MNSWLTRRRLDVPAVYRLVGAQQRMLNDWAEAAPDGPERDGMWRELHRAGDDLEDLLYPPRPMLRYRLRERVRRLCRIG